jgi:F-type H+-transporting ATPase subunit epsilon
MAEAFKFELVSPERLLVSEEVESVIIPAADGEMTVMARHAPVMATIRPGVVTVRSAAGGEQRYVVFGGFADILPEGCTLLAESAVAVKDIDRPISPGASAMRARTSPTPATMPPARGPSSTSPI